MAELSSWCIAPSEGYAFVDGVFVQTDTFFDPRPDRVFPILKEEQPCMWFLVKQEIKALQKQRTDTDDLTPVRVLDVGTGSGFFAILAAKQGCFVTALDRSSRAYRVAGDNAIRNGLRPPDDSEAWKAREHVEFDLPSSKEGGRNEKERTESTTSRASTGRLTLLRMEMKDFSRPKHYGFDIVLLTPPYNPTHKDLAEAVAFHATAGETGQYLYEQQVRFLKEKGWLKPNGICVINHLSCFRATSTGEVVQADALREENLGRLSAIELAHKHIGTDIDIEVYPGLSKTYPACDFLREQYMDLSGSLPDFEKYLSCAIDESGGAFAYIFIVLQQRAEGTSSLSINPLSGVSSVKPEDLHGADWHTRVRAHRQVVNSTPRFMNKVLCGSNALANTTMQSLAGFLSPPADRIVLSTQKTSSQQETNDTREPPCEISGIRILEEIQGYIVREHLDRNFPMILVNTVPMHGGDRSRIQHKLGVWCSGFFEAETTQIQDAWSRTLWRLRDADMPMFTHPAFAGFDLAAGEGVEPAAVIDEDGVHWPMVLWSAPTFGHRQQGDGDKVWLAAYDVYREKYNETAPQGASTARPPAPYEAGFAAISWDDIGEKYDFNHACAESIKRCKKLGMWPKEGKEGKEATGIVKDEAMLLHHFIKTIFAEECETHCPAVLDDSAWLIAIPLGHLYMPKRRRSGNDAPDHYRGAVWIYAQQADIDSSEAQSALWNLALFIWSIVMGEYDAQWETKSAESQLRVGQAAEFLAWTRVHGHEFTKLYSGLLDLTEPCFLSRQSNDRQTLINAFCRAVMSANNLATATGKGEYSREPLLGDGDGTRDAYIKLCRLAYQLHWLHPDRRPLPSSSEADWERISNAFAEDDPIMVDTTSCRLLSPTTESIYRTREWVALIVLSIIRNALKHSVELPEFVPPIIRVSVKGRLESPIFRCTVTNTHNDTDKRDRFLAKLRENNPDGGTFYTLHQYCRALCPLLGERSLSTISYIEGHADEFTAALTISLPLEEIVSMDKQGGAYEIPDS